MEQPELKGAAQTRAAPFAIAALSPLPPRAAYDRWAARYATTGRNPLSLAAAQVLTEVLPVLYGRRVLDVGCGDGRWAAHARASGAAAVLGVDFSAGMLAAARAASPDLGLVAADMRALPFRPATFDVVIHALALGHVPDPGPAIRAAAGVLAPGGGLALVDLHPEAAARGWRRTFRDAGGRRQAVRWHPHALSEVTAACGQAGLRVERLVERALDPECLPPHAPAAATGGPAVYALWACA